MVMKELELLYEKALGPVFGNKLCIIHESDDFATIILDGQQEDFYFTLYGAKHVRLYWCNECFIFDKQRNNLVSSDTYGEVVFESDFDIEYLPYLIVDLIMQLKDCTYITKREIVKGKIPSGYDDIKEYVIMAKTENLDLQKYQLANITIEYIGEE